MKVKELRIGNYAKYDPTGETVIITDLAGERFIQASSLRGKHNKIGRLITPIPLTEEWILKLGFKEEDYEALEYISQTYFSIKTEKGKRICIDVIPDYHFTLNFGGDYCSESILYVYQLQNLYFALTGEELILRE